MIDERRNSLVEGLTEEQTVLLERLESRIFECQDKTVEDAFEKGFSLGVRMVFEAMYDH